VIAAAVNIITAKTIKVVVSQLKLIKPSDCAPDGSGETGRFWEDEELRVNEGAEVPGSTVFEPSTISNSTISLQPLDCPIKIGAPSLSKA
jgi:hypothetical protein